MGATQFLRKMHADQKRRFKCVLAAEPAQARHLWNELQPALTLHEQIEETLLYKPVLADMGPGTRLGDWNAEHELQVDMVQQLVKDASGLEPSDPRWRMTVSKIHDLLHKHIMVEELEIFPRIDQALSPDDSQRIGERMQDMLERGPTMGPVAAAIEQSPIGKVLRR
jgi:iron-sulfur cluster repair protein YtfE (RIC family)